MIGTKTHGYIDYVMGIALAIAPWVLGFASNGAHGAETWVMVLLGAGTILYSLMTDYEMGASRIISMRTHLVLDVLAGAFLAASPWILDFHEFVYAPHVVLGIAEIAIALVTKTHPSNERQKHSAAATH